MYLDTKNLAASGSNNTTTATTATTTTKSARRMRKVWLPLRRLLTVGGKGRATTQPHPNNVDLNNTQLLLPPLELLDNDNDSSKVTTPDDSIKLQVHQQELTEPELPLPPCNTPTLISSVYVEKAATQSCNACQHGRNCQHTHHSSNASDITTQLPPSATPTLWDLQLPLQYISTDNGTFFWANTQERVDDDLLHAWLCQSFSQLPGTLC